MNGGLTRIAARHRRSTLLFVVVVVLGVWTLEANAGPMAPIGIVYDTALKKGEWTLSYIYRRFEGDGLRKGTDRISSADAASTDITQIPVEMQTEIHTIGIQHALFERLTIAINVPLVRNKMRQRDFDDEGSSYTTRSAGVGDFEIVGVIPFMEKRAEKLDVHLGLRLPTAEISNRDDQPDGDGGSDNTLLPRSMQTGSHTVSVITGLSYRGEWQGLGWGVHGTGTIGFAENRRDYRHGNRIEIAGWLGHDLTSWLSGSLRLGFDYQRRDRRERVAGPENHLDSLRSSTANKLLALSPGFSMALPGLADQRVSVEASWPVYQAYGGTQVERDWSLVTGWEWAF